MFEYALDQMDNGTASIWRMLCHSLQGAMMDFEVGLPIKRRLKYHDVC